MRCNVIGALRLRHGCFALALVGALRVASALAEPVELPADVPALPAVTESARLVTAAGSYPYRKIIPPELYPLVKADILPLSVREGEADFPRGAAFKSFSESPGDVGLKYDGTLVADLTTVAGFPFGNAELVGAEKSSMARAQKILWNVEGNFLTQRQIQIEAQLYSWRQRTRGAELRFSVNRLYPAMVPGAGKGLQLFREILRVTEPKQIAGLAHLTFRFVGPDEDFLWFSSPVLKQTRQLTGSNRSDPIVRFPLTLEDLLVWGGKVELVDPQVERSMVGLVPWAAPITAEPQGKECFLARSVGDPAVLKRVVSEGRSAGTILSTAAVWQPRWLWRIELPARDPFARYGRQVLYVDSQTMLPVMKAVYDPSGNFQKVVLGVWSPVSTVAGGFPALQYLYVFNVPTGEQLLVHLRSTTSCPGITDGAAALQPFDPRRLTPGGTSTTTTESAPAASAVPAQEPTAEITIDVDD